MGWGPAEARVVVIEKRLLAEWAGGVFAGMRLSEAWYGAESRMPPHAHATASVSLVVTGGFLERIDGRRRSGPGLSVIAKPSGVVHETCCGAASRTLTLEMPTRVESMLRARVGVFERVGHDDEPRLTAGLIELWARALEPGLARDDAWMEGWWRRCGSDLAQERERRLDPRIDVALGAGRNSATEVAEAVGVHPVHLCRLFRAATGRGTAANLRRARVRRAAGELSRRGSLVGVAAACGFADQAHMTRAFVRETGVTPGVLRAMLVDRV